MAPGFIDAHTHDDMAVLKTPEMLPKISQGVTSVVVGNCGISAAPIRLTEPPKPPLNLLGAQPDFVFERFADYAAAVERTRPAVNVAALVGHGTLRVRTMPDLDRRATQSEIVRDAPSAGAEPGARGRSDSRPACSTTSTAARTRTKWSRWRSWLQRAAGSMRPTCAMNLPASPIR